MMKLDDAIKLQKTMNKFWDRLRVTDKEIKIEHLSLNASALVKVTMQQKGK